MKLNILHISDINKLVRAAILGVCNEERHRVDSDIKDHLASARTELERASNNLEYILNQDMEGRKWI